VSEIHVILIFHIASKFYHFDVLRLDANEIMYKALLTILKKDNIHNCKLAVRWIGNINHGTALDEDLVNRLETVSLVGFSKNSGFEVLSASVEFADRITRINTTNVQPLITVLENW
jgi:hypothetical protein